MDADKSGRASPLGTILSKVQLIDNSVSLEGPRLSHLRTVADNRSNHVSPATLVKKTTLLLDKSAKKLAHLQDSELSRSGRASPIVSHLAVGGVSAQVPVLSSLARPTAFTPTARSARSALSGLDSNSIATPLASSSVKLYTASCRVSVNSERDGPVSFFAKYLSAHNVDGCVTPTASYPGLDSEYLEEVRRRQEDLRRGIANAGRVIFV